MEASPITAWRQSIASKIGSKGSSLRESQPSLPAWFPDKLKSAEQSASQTKLHFRHGKSGICGIPKLNRSPKAHFPLILRNYTCRPTCDTDWSLIVRATQSFDNACNRYLSEMTQNPFSFWPILTRKKLSKSGHFFDKFRRIFDIFALTTESWHFKLR